MGDNITVRQGPGRRERDAECDAHEKRLDDVDNEVHKQSGWLKASAILLTIGIVIVGILNNNISTKLTSIQNMLSDTKVLLAQHAEQIKTLEFRVNNIEERNKYIDQQSGLLGSRHLEAVKP